MLTCGPGVSSIGSPSICWAKQGSVQGYPDLKMHVRCTQPSTLERLHHFGPHRQANRRADTQPHADFR